MTDDDYTLTKDELETITAALTLVIVKYGENITHLTPSANDGDEFARHMLESYTLKRQEAWDLRKKLYAAMI